MSKSHIFKFKNFDIAQDQCTMKVGTDGVLLGAWSDITAVNSVLDIGTGTGIIALMLAQRTDNAQVDAVEIDKNSYNQAKSNFNNSPWSKNMSISHIAIQDYVQECSILYDLIVCNPPFFSGGSLSSNKDKNIVRHTIKLSHQDLLRSARSLLGKRGRFTVILPLIEGLRFIEMAETYGLHINKQTEVKPKTDKQIERLLLEFGKLKTNKVVNELIIQKEARNDWTDEYIDLTKDFHITL